MSNFNLNKLAASILLASLIIMLISFIANLIYKPNLNTKIRGYKIQIANYHKVTNIAQEEQKEVDLAELMKNANAAAGKKIIRKCISCHSFDKGGKNKIGPNLWNIYNAPKGKYPANYAFSKAMKSKGGIWDMQSLFTFLEKPSKYIPGTKMSFMGIKNAKKRADIIAFLKTNTDSKK